MKYNRVPVISIREAREIGLSFTHDPAFEPKWLEWDDEYMDTVAGFELSGYSDYTFLNDADRRQLFDMGISPYVAVFQGEEILNERPLPEAYQC